METHEVQQHRDEKRIQRYLQRVNDFYGSISDWLQEYPDITLIKTPFERSELEVGNYTTEKLSIKTKDNQGYQVTVDMIPGGANIIMTEGTIEIEGWRREYLAYMQKGGPKRYDPTTKTKKSIYQGVNQDGWYWINDYDNTRLYQINKPLLLKLISELSDHAFQ